MFRLLTLVFALFVSIASLGHGTVQRQIHDVNLVATRYG